MKIGGIRNITDMATERPTLESNAVIPIQAGESFA